MTTAPPSPSRRPWPRDGRYLVGDDGVVVCETFHGPRPAGMQAAHQDGDPANNAAVNLQWAPPPDNAADRVRHGTNGRGLDAAAVEAIRASDASTTELALRFAVTPGAIRHVRHGRTWRRLPAA